LEIWTNGSISPVEAVGKAASILDERLKDLQRQLGFAITEPDSGIPETATEPKADDKLSMPLLDLEFSVRSRNCLGRAGLDTVGDLVRLTEEDLLKVRNLGTKSAEEIKQVLQDRLGLALRQPTFREE
jgi:DNA-directed RNA polymerase subunit alpha